MSLSNMQVDSSCVSPQETTNGVFEYSHMVVPATMRSRYWQYFGFPCDNFNNILTKKKIICTLCSTAISYNKNTTNLRTHLVAKHPSVLYQLNGKRYKLEDKSPDSSIDSKLKLNDKDLERFRSEAEERKISEQNVILEALVDNEIIVNEADKMDERKAFLQDYSSSLDAQTYQVEEIDEVIAPSPEGVCESLASMFVKDMLPPSIVEGMGFTNFVFTISPNVVLPSKEQIEKNLKNNYDTTFNSQFELIKNHTNKYPFSIGIELWCNVECAKFINIYVYLIPEQSENLQSFLLKTVRIEESTNYDVMNGINLSHCSAAIVNTSEDLFNDLLDVHGIPTAMCFWTVIQNCFRAAFKVTEADTLLNDVQKYMQKFSHLEQDESTIPRIHEAFPITKLNYLSHFYDKFTSYFATWTEEGNYLLEKTKSIVDCLTPLKVTLETISDESVSLYSLLKPLTTKLMNEYFRVSPEDLVMIASIKEVVSIELSESIINKTFPELASFFDPRFLSYMDSDSFEMVKNVINSQLKASDDAVKVERDDIDTHNKRKSSLKMFFENDDYKRNPKVAKTCSELEIHKYANEVCDMDQCPLTWWNECGYVYRRLKTVAQHYICVPATLNNMFKKSMDEQIDFYNKQQGLKSELERSLLFLHLNK